MGDYEIELTVSEGRQSSTDRLKVSSNNVGPVAEAGADQLVSLGSTVMLDGASSSDLNSGDTLSYQWSFERKPVGSLAEMTNASSLQASFLPDKPGDYEVILTVNDGNLSSVDHLTVSTENISPVVEITPPMSSPLSTALNLSATVMDEDDLTYRWSVLSAFP